MNWGFVLIPGEAKYTVYLIMYILSREGKNDIKKNDKFGKIVIMEALQIKETLHEYIDTADEKKLEAIYTVLKDSIPDGYEYNQEELEKIYDRRIKYKKGEEQLMTVEELLLYVRQNKLKMNGLPFNNT